MPVPGDQARMADLRGFLTLPEGTRIDAIETYCSGCRGAAYADVAHLECDAKAPLASRRRDHLMEGTPSERARRVITEETDRRLVRARSKRALLR